MIKCEYCGAMNEGAYKGTCPKCPEGAMEDYHIKNELQRLEDFLNHYPSATEKVLEVVERFVEKYY